MRASRSSEAQILVVLREQEAGGATVEAGPPAASEGHVGQHVGAGQRGPLSRRRRTIADVMTSAMATPYHGPSRRIPPIRPSTW